MLVFCSDCNGLRGVARLRPKGASPVERTLEAGARPQLEAQRPQDAQQLSPELHSHKGVQDGIEAAVQVTQGGCHHLGFLQVCSDSTGLTSVALMNCVHHKSDIVRRPTDKENHHHGDNDFESSLLLEALVATAQLSQDAGVAEDQDS